ncbi:MAG: GyrI-like domain-containing protein [Parvularcula sp.]
MGGFLKFIVATVLVLAAALVAIIAWYGGFSPVEVKKGRIGPIEIVYATHKGPYTDLGPSWTAFRAELSDAGLETCDALGIYLDPPETPPEELRSIIGCRIDRLPATDREKLTGYTKIATIPESETVTATFPFKGIPSFFIGPMKVYPAMKKAQLGIDAEPVVAIELYGDETDTDEIIFHVPYGRPASDYQVFFDAFE